MTAIGLLFVVIVLVFPRGILGLVARRARALRHAPAPAALQIQSPPAPLEEGPK
jgi:hypothetical protein